MAKETEAYACRALGGLGGLYKGLVAPRDGEGLGSIGVGFPGIAYSLLGSQAFSGPRMVLSAIVGAPGGPVIGRCGGCVARGIAITIDRLLSIVLLYIPPLLALKALLGLSFFIPGLTVE